MPSVINFGSLGFRRIDYTWQFLFATKLVFERISHFTVCFQPSIFCMSSSPYSDQTVHLFPSTLWGMLLIFQTLQRQAAHVGCLKTGDTHRKEFLIDWNNEQVSMWLLKPKGQRAMLLQEQTGIVLSTKNQPACGSVACASLLSLKLGAPVGVAWRDLSQAGWGDLWGEMFWLWLSACYAGIQAGKYVGEITGLQEECMCLVGGVGGGSDHPPFLIQCDQALTHVVDKWSLSQ